MKDKIDINLIIADVALQLTVNLHEEKLYRDAAKGINDAWHKWRKQFRDKSPGEVHAMVTLLFAKGFLELKEQTDRAAALLESVEATLDSLLLEDKTDPGQGK